METYPRISLEQWRALVAVVEDGGYAQAALSLNKTQSTVTYAVQKIERLLGLKVFAIEGRKARLTEQGEVLYRRAKLVLEEAAALERNAREYAAGGEVELALAVEILFPTWLLLECLDAFSREFPNLRIELYETVLGGTEEALAEGRVQLAITPHVPRGFVGELLMPVHMVAVASPRHPLHRLGRSLSLRDLRAHRHLLIRDTARERTREAGWLDARQSWTFGSKATSIRAACMGLGYARYAYDSIRRELASGELVPLPLRHGAGEVADAFYLVFADPEFPGPAATRLAQIVRDTVRAQHPEHASDGNDAPAASASDSPGSPDPSGVARPRPAVARKGRANGARNTRRRRKP